MDAGLAAVLGALAGSSATIGAALATGWAQRESARIVARAEHRRERRQPREAAYEEFIADAAELNSQIIGFTLSDPLPRMYSDDDMQHLRETVWALNEKATKVALKGPRDVGQAAMQLGKLAGFLMLPLSQLQGEMRTSPPDGEISTVAESALRQVSHSAKEFDRSLNSFILMAQESLDDDGSRN